MITKFKQFYGPTFFISTVKIILTTGMLITLIYLQNRFSSNNYGYGMPLIFYKFTCQFEIINNECSNFNIFALVFDYIFLYTAISFIFQFARNNSRTR